MERITILEEQLKKDHDTVLLFTPTCVPPSGSLPYNTVCTPLPQSYEEPNEDVNQLLNSICLIKKNNIYIHALIYYITCCVPGICHPSVP